MSQWRDEFPVIDQIDQIIEDSNQQVRTWVAEASKLETSKSASLLSAVLQDENGLNFAVGFVDGVVRPESLRISARNLFALRKLTPKLLPLWMRVLIPIGALLAPLAPWPVVPIARFVLRKLVGHLIIDASPANLSKALRTVKAKGFDLNVNLLGEAVLGIREADKRLAGVAELLRNPDVDYVSMKVSAAIAPHNPWAFDDSVAEIVERLTPLYLQAAASDVPKFINLDMEEYKDLGLTIAVFKSILGRKDLLKLRAGIVLQAYLPDAMATMHDLQKWASARRAQGGAPIKVRIVKGANLPMEIVDAELHDWPLAVVESKQAADTNYKRVVNYALTHSHLANVEVGIAGHNLFDIAFAHALMKRRMLRQGVSFEMLLGMAQSQAMVVSKDVGKILLYTPVVAPTEFDVAIAYLIRRLEESANSSNFMSAVFELDKQPELYQRELERFKASVHGIATRFADSNRVQNRLAKTKVSPQPNFKNTPDSDPAITANKKWAAELFDGKQLATIGVKEAQELWIHDATILEAKINKAKAAAKRWQKLTSGQRATNLRKVAVALEQNRGRLIQVMMSEAGKSIDQADPEVSEAIDFANYYAERAIELGKLDGAKHVPSDVVLVTPPWNFPVAIPAGSVLAALAAGSAVVLKPAPQVTRCGALLNEILVNALPSSVVTTVQVSETELGEQLIANPKFDQLVLTGSFETAQLFKKFNPALRIIGETSGKNAIIVSEYADLDLAAKDVAASAFGHAGQKCSAASLVILVGSVAKSDRFKHQLLDAARSLTVDFAENPLAQVGPLIEAPNPKLLHGLTKLDGQETWLLEPKQLDTTGRLWSPGIRTNVQPGATSHLTEYFGPVLSIMTAKNLAEAIELQNATDYGLTAGLHSLNGKEIETWLDKVQAGNLYINRSITGAIVQRQPFGGWKKSAVGATAKAGGPNYLFAFGRFETAKATTVDIMPSSNVLRALELISQIVDRKTNAALTRAAASDAANLADVFGKVTDVTGLSVERNLFRYMPEKCVTRLDEADTQFERYRKMLAAASVGGQISAAEIAENEKPLAKLLGIKVESDETLIVRLKAESIARVRWQRSELEIGIATFANPAVESGRVELLCHFKEQSIAITNHRFGNPLKYSIGL